MKCQKNRRKIKLIRSKNKCKIVNNNYRKKWKKKE